MNKALKLFLSIAIIAAPITAMAQDSIPFPPKAPAGDTSAHFGPGHHHGHHGGSEGHDFRGRPDGKDIPKLTVEQRAHMVTDQMDRLLTLTDKQYQKVYKLNLKEIKEMEADSLFLGRRGMGFGPGFGPGPGGPGGPGNRAQFERDMAKAGREFTPLSQQQMEQLREAHEKSRLKKDKKLRKILTEEQYGKWVKAEQERLVRMQQMREGRGRGRGFGPGGPRPDGNATTPAQKPE